MEMKLENKLIVRKKICGFYSLTVVSMVLNHQALNFICCLILTKILWSGNYPHFILWIRKCAWRCEITWKHEKAKTDLELQSIWLQNLNSHPYLACPSVIPSYSFAAHRKCCCSHLRVNSNNAFKVYILKTAKERYCSQTMLYSTVLVWVYFIL